MRNRIVDLISESGVGFKEKANTIYTTCPICGRDDKFSILKKSGSCICYRGSCTFGKRPFREWVALTFRITDKEAGAKLFGERAPDVVELKSQWTLKRPSVQEDESPTDELLASLKPMSWPEFHMIPLADPGAIEGANYMATRGISLETAVKYDLAYSKTYRRVYFPIKMSGECYGYQGRHIDKVEDALRVRNNEGFQREVLVMFADNLIGSEFAIVAEGPVDAVKFDLVGGNICTMGKVVTDKQLDIIRSYGIQKMYLALDDDALFEMNALIDKAGLATFLIEVPKSCVDRCREIGKKADFGECTYEEARVAFENATPFKRNTRVWRPVTEGK